MGDWWWIVPVACFFVGMIGGSVAVLLYIRRGWKNLW